jgi:hypothetical protein
MALAPGATPCAEPPLVAVPIDDRANHKRVVVYLPSAYFISGAETLADYNPSLGCARQSVMLLIILAHLVSSPWLCTSEGTSNVNEISAENKALVFQSAPDAAGVITTAERTVTTLEVVRTVDGVGIAGLRFWFDVQDPTMDLNRGIQTLIIKNCEDHERMSKRGGKPPPPPPQSEVYRTITKRIHWINGFLSAQSFVKDPAAELSALWEERNAANIYGRLGAERGIDMVHTPHDPNDPADEPRVHQPVFAAQQSRHGYLVNAGDDGIHDKFIWTRPEDTYHLGTNNATVHAFLTCRLPHLGPAPGSLNAAVLARRLLNPAQFAVEALLAQQHSVSFGIPAPDPNRNSMDILADMAKSRQVEFDAVSPDAYDRANLMSKWSRSQASLDQFEAAFLGGSACAKVNGAAEWIRMQEAAAPGGIWHAVDADRRAIDPALSHFGNFYAHFGNDLEQFHGVKSLHSTIVMTWVAALTAHQMSFDLKVNVIFPGPAAVGKSYVMDLLKLHLLPAFMVNAASRFTKCAFQTSTDKVHDLYVSDEFDNDLIGLDRFGRTVGTGDPIFKALMTSQEVTVQSFAFDLEGNRIMVTTKSRMPCVFVGATNYSMHAIPAPICSRMVVRPCFELDRPNHDIQEKDFARAQSGGERVSTRAVDYRYQKLAVLGLIVEQLIYTRRIQPPSMLTAKIMMLRICAYLDAQGIDTKRAMRATYHVEKLARKMVILNALDIVFNTTTVFAADKPFELKDVMQCEIYMQCTEEMIWFAFQMLSDQFLDVDAARPVVAIAIAEAKYTPGAAATASTVFYRHGDVPDFNYVLVKGIFSDKGTGTSHVRALAMRMATSMTRGSFTTSIENIEGIIQSMTESRMFSEPFAGLGQEKVPGAARESFPHIVVDTQTNSARISRHWLDKVVTPEYADIATAAVKSCQHAHTASRRVLSGISYVSDPSAGINGGSGAAGGEKFIMAPHIWRCIDVRPDPRKVLRIPNAQGFDLSRPRPPPRALASSDWTTVLCEEEEEEEDGAEETVPSVFEATEDLEVTEFKRRVRAMCVAPDEIEQATRALPAAMRRLCRETAMMQERGRTEGDYPVRVKAEYDENERDKTALMLGLGGGNRRKVASLASMTRSRPDDLDRHCERKMQRQ